MKAKAVLDKRDPGQKTNRPYILVDSCDWAGFEMLTIREAQAALNQLSKAIDRAIDMKVPKPKSKPVPRPKLCAKHPTYQAKRMLHCL